MQQSRTQPAFPRSFQLTLFLIGGIWVIFARNLADRAAQGIANRLDAFILDQLLQQVFFLFLLLWGFSAIAWISTRRSPSTSTDVRSMNSLPSRPTARQEWQRGAALGWGVLLIAILPIMLTGNLHPEFAPAPRNWGLTLLSLATLAIATLGIEVAFRGFIYARLIKATTPVVATLLLSLFYAIFSGYGSNATLLSIIVTFFLSILFSLAYLRTHALWLGWGLHFAFSASMAVLFGLPIASNASYNNLVLTSVSGPGWLSGGPYGPQAAAFTIVVVLAAIPILYRITRTYEWEYTHPPIVAAGYPMDIAPPAAHTAMEATAAPAPLVQILSTTSTTSSTLPIIDEHLRRETDTTPRN